MAARVPKAMAQKRTDVKNIIDKLGSRMKDESASPIIIANATEAHDNKTSFVRPDSFLHEGFDLILDSSDSGERTRIPISFDCLSSSPESERSKKLYQDLGRDRHKIIWVTFSLRASVRISFV